MKETLKHKEAFNYYYSLGDKRGLRAVAQKFNTSLTSLAKWSVDFGWQARVDELDQEIIKSLEKQLKNEFVKDKLHYYNLVKKAISVYQANLLKGSVKLNTVSEFEKLMNIAVKLSGGEVEAEQSGTIIVQIEDDD